MVEMFTSAQVREELQLAVQHAGGITAYAAKHNLGYETVRLALVEKRPLTPSLLKALGYRRETFYSKVVDHDQ